VTLRGSEETDRSAEKDLDLPARSPASRSLAEGRRFGEAGRNLIKKKSNQYQFERKTGEARKRLPDQTFTDEAIRYDQGADYLDQRLSTDGIPTRKIKESFYSAC